MTMLQHTGISTVLAAGLWFLTGPWAAASCLAAGVLVDLDHLVDYILNYPRRGFHLHHFFYAFKVEVLNRVFVFLHAWELVGATWMAAWWSGWHPALLGTAIGLGAHLFMDQIFNAHTPAAYLLSYRIRHRFDGRRFYGNREIERRRAITNPQTEAKGKAFTSKADR